MVFVISFVSIANAENLWKDYLDGKIVLPPIIKTKEDNIEKRNSAIKKYLTLKKQRKQLEAGFFHRLFGTNNKKIKKINKEISQAKKDFFKYKSNSRRISSKQQKALRRSKHRVINNRQNSNQRRVLK